MTVSAGAWSEPALIRFAHAFEQATNARTAPRFLATADLTPSAIPAATVAAAGGRPGCGI